jgi:gentisate 1,2-dioxygenase
MAFAEMAVRLDGWAGHSHRVVLRDHVLFSEEHNDQSQSIRRPEGESLARFGEGLLPIEAGSRYGLTTPIFNYPYERTRHALLTAAEAQSPDPHWAVTMRYANPLDGGWTMPTISAWITYVPRGFETTPMRSTDGMNGCR